MQRCLYLVLRWYMDRKTGRVGEARGISLQSLAEELYVEPVRGRHAAECGSPSKKAIRSALDGLEKAGLITPCGNGEVLVFFLQKSRRVSARPKDEGHMRGTDEGHDEGRIQNAAESSASSGKYAVDKRHDGRDEGHTKNHDEGHTSRTRVNNPSQQASAAACDRPLKNLSTPPVLVMPLQPEKVAEWIRLHERQRGCRAKAISSAPQIAAWVAKGVEPGQLQEAYSLAVLDREVSSNPAPVNLPFLDIFVNRVLDICRAARKSAGQSVELWPYTWEGLSGKAKELAMQPWQAGEGFDDFQKRVLAAHRKANEPTEVAHG